MEVLQSGHMRWQACLIFILTVGCAGFPAPSQTGAPASAASRQILTVFAASSLTNAFKEIGSLFEAEHPGITISFNFAGSQTLRTQIMEGAPADVVALASTEDMDFLLSQKLLDSSPRIFASNKMIVILPHQNPARIRSLEDLTRPGVKIVLAAQTVPAGRYAREVLTNLDASLGADFSSKVLANVVSNEENVRQAVAKVQLGEAEAGMVYYSDAAAAPDLLNLQIPAKFNVNALYPVGVSAHASHPELADTFIDSLLSRDGQVSLQAWGFLPPP